MDLVMSTLINMQLNGLLSRDMEEDSVEVYTIGKEYKIVLSRKSSKLFQSDRSSSYICSMDIYDIIGTLKIHITSDENTMARFIDVVYWLQETGQDLLFNIGQYMIHMSRYGENYKVDFGINNGSYVAPVLTLLFDYDLIDKFLNGLYFMFLIDIDDGTKTALAFYDINTRQLLETGGII